MDEKQQGTPEPQSWGCSYQRSVPERKTTPAKETPKNIHEVKLKRDPNQQHEEQEKGG